MKYKELKSLVEQVMVELNLAQGKNRIPSKKKSKKRPDYPDVDNDGDKEESMEKALKDKKKNKVKAEYNNPEEEDDDVITKPGIEEPAPKTKPRHPLMPPEESPEDEPKMRVKKEGKISINDILTKYKNLKKNEA